MAESAVTSRLGRLNLFSKAHKKVDDEDEGEEIDSGTVAGGGHGGRQTDITKNQLRVSQAMRAFLVNQRVISEKDAGLGGDPNHTTEALWALLDKPHVDVPRSNTDRSHPLPDYFISSSHNTYLRAHQLFGSSSADAYETALSTGSRCIEIDAWDGDDNNDEPKVTHGYTLVSNISFRSVCETIRDVVDKEAADQLNKQGYRAAPILVSLENHCNAHGQQRLVQIMREVWGDRLLSEAVRQEGHREQQGSGEHVRLEELGSKIVVIVEYQTADQVNDSHDDDDSSSSSSEDETEKIARKEYKKKQKEAPAGVIIPELADLGVYAQSVKPGNKSWYDEVEGNTEPHHPLINVSESGLGSHMPTASDKIARHNAHHLMRVYPKGNRISSKNLNPVPFWGVGAQICALNWQTFGAAIQLNEALFSGSDGYVLKPAALRIGGNGKLSTGRKKKLRLHVAGASDVPVPAGREADDIKPYVTCTLVHPDDLQHQDHPSKSKRKTAAYKQHKLSTFLHSKASAAAENPPPSDPIWNETLEWEYEDNELVFLRLLIKSDDSFARNPKFAVAAVRLSYVVPSDWVFIRMLDLKGRETRCSLLVKFDFL